MSGREDLHTRLLAATETRINRYLAALRAVVELHAPVLEGNWRNLPGYWVCTGCEGREPVDWPCSTIQAIADQLGITEGDRRD